jgi:hypothetical protein
MGRCPSLLGMVFLTLGVLAVAALAQEPAVSAPPPPAEDNPAPTRGSLRLATPPTPAFHARFSLN